MTKALISLPSLSLIAALALSGCSLSVGGGSSSQAQKSQTQVTSDSEGSVGTTGGAAASATGTAASTGQAVAGYEPGQIPPIPMIALPDLSLLTQSTGAFTPDLTRSITSQPGVTVRPARCDASGSLVSGSTVLGGDGSMSTSSGATAVTNNGDGSGTYSDGKVSITNNGDGSGTYSDGKVSITINGDGSGTYSDDHLSVTVNGDGSGTYSDSATGEAITLDGKGSGTYSRGGVSITNNGDGSGTYSDGKISITNLGDGSAIVNDATVSAPKVQVQGHTDSVSDDASNQTLSEQRAKAVTEALTSNGVTASIESVGYGETKPVAPNENSDGSDNPAGRRLNRRVEVFVPAF